MGSVSSKKSQNEYVIPLLAILTALKLSSPSLFKDLFINRVKHSEYTNDYRNKIQERFNNINESLEKESGTYYFNVATPVAEKFIKNRQVIIQPKYFRAEIKIDLNKLIDLSRLLVTKSPDKMAGQWDYTRYDSTPAPLALTYMLFTKRNDIYGTSKQGYIDLVEMASDLT